MAPRRCASRNASTKPITPNTMMGLRGVELERSVITAGIPIPHPKPAPGESNPRGRQSLECTAAI